MDETEAHQRLRSEIASFRLIISHLFYSAFIQAAVVVKFSCIALSSSSSSSSSIYFARRQHMNSETYTTYT